MTSCWMASLGIVYGSLLGNCGYQPIERFMTKAHRTPLAILSWSVHDKYKLAFARGRENYQSNADEVAFLLALTIAVMLLIIKLIYFFIEQALVWIFISFGFLLIGFLLGIALADCYIFWWFFVLLACVFITSAAVSVWLNPDDSRTGEYIRAISVSYMIAYLYF